MIRVLNFALVVSMLSTNAMAGGAGSSDNLASRFMEKNSSETNSINVASEAETADIQVRSLSTGSSFLAGTATLLNAADDAGICTVAPSTEPETQLSAVGPSLVFNNPTELKRNNNFSFAKTIQKIIDTSGDSNTTTPIQMVESMMSTYKTEVSSKINDESGVKMTLDARPGEAALQASELLEGLMEPTALFNRLDLAPSDGGHCGEYRIVYHKENQTNFGRFFIIFEGQYPNPSPSEGLAGCLPVADFWVSLNNMDASTAATKLEEFFYQGIEQEGVMLPAVVDFNNYKSGQVRTNNFVNGNWQLREFKSELNKGTAAFNMVTVKANPLSELYGNDTASLPSENDASKVSELFKAYKADFITQYINQLVNPELSGVAENTTALINSIGFDPDNKYNEFQSTAGSADEPAGKISSEFNSGIATGLSGHENQKVQVITADMLLHRAGAMTCGGCHQFSNAKIIAPGVQWPRSAGFVHVTESGMLSPALQDQFLPFRRDILTDIACDRPEPSPEFQAWLIPIWSLILN